MENKLLALQAEKELLLQARNYEYDKVMIKFEKLIEKHFLQHSNTRLVRRQIITLTAAYDPITYNFEIGCCDEINNVAFGSEVTFYYEMNKKELQINYGTIGNFTKSNSSQIERIKLLYHVTSNIAEIEAAFCQLVEESTAYLELANKVEDIDIRISLITSQIWAEERKRIEESLHVGMSLSYVSDSRLKLNDSSRLFYDTLTIKSISPKFIKFNETNKQLRKETVVYHIQKGFIVTEENQI